VIAARALLPALRAALFSKGRACPANPPCFARKLRSNKDLQIGWVDALWRTMGRCQCPSADRLARPPTGGHCRI